MAEAEFKAVLDLLSSLFLSGRTGVLVALLLMAATIDMRSHRIPNWLVLSGALYAVAYNTFLPPWPNGTILFPLAGLALGLLLFLPLYLLRAMGAGDVKLLAMVGAFVGADDVWRCALASLVAGGGLAIVFVLLRGTALRLYHNLVSLFRVGMLATMAGAIPSLRVDTAASAGKLPYGVAIALGTVVYLALKRFAFI